MFIFNFFEFLKDKVKVKVKKIIHSSRSGIDFSKNQKSIKASNFLYLLKAKKNK